MKVILVGAGRMGLAHLRGLDGRDLEIHVVDPREATEADVRSLAASTGLAGSMEWHRSLSAAPADADAVILAETADGRLERLEHFVSQGVRKILVEKPLEQSRLRTRRVAELVQDHGVEARVNFGFRTLALYASAHEEPAPFRLTVTGGAFGLACNGIHFIDAALFMSRGDSAKLLFAEVLPDVVPSPRGPGFRDYGGEALIRFADTSTLSLHSDPLTRGPIVVTLERPDRTTIVDLQGGAAIVYSEEPETHHPVYRYGVGYDRAEVDGIHRYDLTDVTRQWLRGSIELPTVQQTMPAHELLFDLLETTGEDRFAIT